VSKISDVLSSFTNREFAYFLKYRLVEFSDSSRETIYLEIKSRNLTPKNLEKLVNDKFTPIKGNCSRCNANHFFTETRIEQAGSMNSYEIEVNTYRCIVCGFNEALEVKGFWKRLVDVFSF